ncbi:MAG: FAD-dependent oxidoreductase [Lachnospiraceae bacterium]|nr:FAD-dependent oxidoreductase [Lachnospiraceae bacterium]
MIQINQFKTSPIKDEELLSAVSKHFHVNAEEISDLRIVKKSIDARKKPEIIFSYTLQLCMAETTEKSLVKKNKNITLCDKQVSYRMPKCGEHILPHRPVVAGFGPAGIFAAYLLAKAGFCPIVIERGEDVYTRKETVEEFWQKGLLNTESNVQFGEGGAGTFSDGKLNTGVKDKYGRNRFVLETFVEFGAYENILYDSKPHIGTDVLCDVIYRMRESILKMGGTVLFSNKLESLIMKPDTKELAGIQVRNVITDEIFQLDTECCILAIGHSARDTFEVLYETGLTIEQKSFAVGLRVIHKQKWMNQCQYGVNYEAHYPEILPSASYKLTARAKNGRGVYSFCMCPGGYVVNASSEQGMCAVNGMSNVKRDSGYANSAIVVSVSPKDYNSEHPLAGMYFQRNLEKKAFQLGNGNIPVCLFTDFKAETSDQISAIQITNEYKDAVKGAFEPANISSLFPEEIKDAFLDGMEQFESCMSGFTSKNPLLCAIESRTSSPIKILRDESFNSVNIKGLYPCGEGAGYAGGIMSAAMDGMKVAEGIISCYASLKT